MVAMRRPSATVGVTNVVVAQRMGARAVSLSGGTSQPSCSPGVTLMKLGGPSFAMGDHADHIHVGYAPVGKPSELSKQFAAVLKPDQWRDLIDRIAQIDNPKVPTSPSKYSTLVERRNIAVSCATIPVRGHTGTGVGVGSGVEDSHDAA